MTYNEDLIRVLRAENESLRNRLEFLEAQIEVNKLNIKENYYEQNR